MAGSPEKRTVKAHSPERRTRMRAPATGPIPSKGETAPIIIPIGAAARELGIAIIPGGGRRLSPRIVIDLKHRSNPSFGAGFGSRAASSIIRWSLEKPAHEERRLSMARDRSSRKDPSADPRSEAGRARGAASSRGSWDHPGLHRQQALALQLLARELAGAADRFRLFTDSLLGGFLVMAAELHFAEHALALHLLLQHLEGLVDIVVTDENLHAALLFD